MSTPIIVAIAAVGKNTLYICEGDNLLWHISEDLKRVKELTLNHPIIMGRKTFESIGRPLPNRTNIVLTRDTSYSRDGIKVAHSAEQALEIAKESEGGKEKIVIFGGAEIYKLFLPDTQYLSLTLVDSEDKGTQKFPEFIDEFEFVKTSGGGIYDNKGIPTPYEWVDYKRKDT